MSARTVDGYLTKLNEETSEHLYTITRPFSIKTSFVPWSDKRLYSS